MNPSLITSLGYVRVASIAPVVTVADVEANVEEIIRRAEQAVAEAVDVAVFPELCITGYTCGDLFMHPDLLSGALRGLDRLRRWSAGVPMLLVVGMPLEVSGRLFNTAVVLRDGHILAAIPKTHLPNTNEFYDRRRFASALDADDDTVRIGDADVPFGADLLLADAADPALMMGVEICEDLWSVEPPSGSLARHGATLLVNCSASNETIGKAAYRRDLVRLQSARTYAAYVYASAGPTESTTDTVFGGYAIVAECGDVLAESDRCLLDGTMIVADVDLRRCLRERLNGTSWSAEIAADTVRVIETTLVRTVKDDVRRRIDPHPFVPAGSADRAERCREIINIQATGLAVRVRRSRARTMVVGLSGGLDSTLALLVCLRSARTLGLPPSSILAVSMPGLGTTDRTRTNAERLAAALGVDFRTIPITDAVMTHFRDIGHDPSDTSIVYENAQARERTQILMDLANGCGGIVVGTGDLSEIALGWSTYNADHMSMYNPNGGVPKTLVRHLIAWFADEAGGEAASVLRDILDTPISPELLPTGANGEIAQRTEDVLGPYEVHDFFLYRFVRLREPVSTIAVLAVLAFRDRYEPGRVLDWLGVFLRRFVQNQFKRSCMPDGPKVGSVALSPRADWRMPSDASSTLWEAELRKVTEQFDVNLRK